MDTPRDQQTSDVPTVEDVLALAAQEGNFGIDQPERILIMQATPYQWVLKVTDRDGDFESRILELSAAGA
jgi:hypothetical protein